jgi:hypothetical protein
MRDEVPVMQVISDGYGVKPSWAISLKFLDIFARYVLDLGAGAGSLSRY